MEDNSTISTLHSPKLSKPLKVKKGITEKQIDQLISYAQEDEGVIKFTADKKRFPDREAFDKWKETHSPTIYVLTNEVDDLMGILWFHYLPVPESDLNIDLAGYGVTWAIRLYGEARGKGLSKDFSKVCFEDYMKSKEYKEYKNNGIWLTTSADNIPAVKSYENLGFEDAGYSKKWDKKIMILKV